MFAKFQKHKVIFENCFFLAGFHTGFVFKHFFLKQLVLYLILRTLKGNNKFWYLKWYFGFQRGYDCKIVKSIIDQSNKEIVDRHI